MSGDGLTLEISPQSLDAIAEKVAAILGERSNGDSSPWLTRSGAAAYLGVSLSRLEKDRTVPAHGWAGSRDVSPRRSTPTYSASALDLDRATLYYEVDK